MKKINKKHLSEIAKTLLFEKNVQPNLTVDDGMTPGLNMRYGMYNQAGPQVDGDKNYEPSYEEDIIELPITPDELMPSIHTVKIPRANIESKDYCPANADEFVKATQTLIYNHKKDIDSEHIEKAWRLLNKIIDKVK